MLLTESNDCQYYISPFENVEVGDVVVVLNERNEYSDGVVIDIEYASASTAPQSVRKTPRIERIAVKVSTEDIKITDPVDTLIQKSTTKPYCSKRAVEDLNEILAQFTFFASTVFRGLETDVRAALRTMYPSSFDVLSLREPLYEGVSQFECPSQLVPKIIKEYPNLKAAFFAENWKDGTVWLAYSESGYSTVTSSRFVGKCDFYCRDRWSLIHDPTEQSFSFDGGQYAFTEGTEWEKCDYVLSDGKTQLANEINIPAKPYKKKLTTEPSQIIPIRYPENEKFYTPPEIPVAHKATENAQCSDELSGKIFVVTGDLMHYSSRDELKAIIESAGGKLTGSVSTKTTALITNFPDSGTTKIKKAQELGIEIITEKEFIRRYLLE